MQSEGSEILFHPKTSALNIKLLNSIRSGRRAEIQQIKTRVSVITKENLRNFACKRRNALIKTSF